VNAESLKEVYELLKDVEDDFLQVNQMDSSAEIEINNPETYQAFIQHLSNLNSFEKSKENVKLRKQQKVARNIFAEEAKSESDSHTHSNLSPRSQKRASFKQ
jgi:hypothetical protein